MKGADGCAKVELATEDVVEQRTVITHGVTLEWGHSTRREDRASEQERGGAALVLDRKEEKAVTPVILVFSSGTT